MKLRTKACELRTVVSAEEKARIVAELKAWKADGGLDKALESSDSKIKISKNYKQIRGRW